MIEHEKDLQIQSLTERKKLLEQRVEELENSSITHWLQRSCIFSAFASVPAVILSAAFSDSGLSFGLVDIGNFYAYYAACYVIGMLFAAVAFAIFNAVFSKDKHFSGVRSALIWFVVPAIAFVIGKLVLPYLQ